MQAIDRVGALAAPAVALAWLKAKEPDALGAACPIWSTQREATPGSFWFRRVR